MKKTEPKLATEKETDWKNIAHPLCEEYSRLGHNKPGNVCPKTGMFAKLDGCYVCAACMAREIRDLRGEINSLRKRVRELSQKK